MKYISLPVALGLLLLIPLQSPAEESSVMVSLNFRDAPLYQVIEFYEHFTHQTVTVERAEYPVVTLRPDRRLNRAETISSIETNLAAIGIIFTNTPEGICVRPDPQKMPTNITRVFYSPPTGVVSNRYRREYTPGDYERRRQLQILRKSLPSLPKKEENSLPSPSPYAMPGTASEP